MSCVLPSSLQLLRRHHWYAGPAEGHPGSPRNTAQTSQSGEEEPLIYWFFPTFCLSLATVHPMESCPPTLQNCVIQPFGKSDTGAVLNLWLKWWKGPELSWVQLGWTWVRPVIEDLLQGGCVKPCPTHAAWETQQWCHWGSPGDTCPAPGCVCGQQISEVHKLGRYLTVGVPCGSAGKESACNAETWVRSLGWEDPLEKGKATHSSILAWRIPWTA